MKAQGATLRHETTRAGMRCEILSRKEYARVVDDLPVQLWNSSAALEVYGTAVPLVCFSRSGGPVAAWVVPLDSVDDRAAKRTHRLLPYASPWIDGRVHATVRHRAASAMCFTLKGVADSIDIPMDPCFAEVAALLEQGIRLATRHTRVLGLHDLDDLQAGYIPGTRNHIRAAGRSHTVVETPAEHFEFQHAIVNQSTDAIEARGRSGLALSQHCKALSLSAVDIDGICRGQVFVLHSGVTAILMHSWFDRTGGRGVPSLLVTTAINRAREGGAEAFDFEGSVIPDIDRFMSGFGAAAVPYSHATWSRYSRDEAHSTDAKAPVGVFG